jgi:hypothetical protein
MKRFHFTVHISRPNLGRGKCRMHVDASHAWIAWRDLAQQYADIQYATSIDLDRVEPLTQPQE